MPFLRRRGVMASDSDMRRHNTSSNMPLPEAFPNASKLLQQQREEKEEQHLQQDGPPRQQQQSSSGGPLPALSTDIPPSGTPIDASPAAASSTAPTNDSPSDALTMAPSIPSIELPDRSQSPPIQDEGVKHRRFSMLRFRNASDSQLSSRAKQQAQAAASAPPVPKPPEIITTAPPMDLNLMQKKQSRRRLPFGLGKPGEESLDSGPATLSKKDRRKTFVETIQAPSNKPPAISFDEPRRPYPGGQPPPYGDETEGSGLSLPINRLSESSRSDASSGDRVYGSTTTTTHTVHTTTTFFRLPRRKHKQPEPLFPIAHLQRSQTQVHGGASMASLSSAADSEAARARTPTQTETPTPSRPASARRGASTPALAGTTAPLPQTKSNMSPATALFRPGSRNSGQSSPTRGPLHLRGRSSTMSSAGRDSLDDRLAPPTTRTSTSTGRKSFGDLLGLSKLRQNSDMSGRQGTVTPATPASSTSKNNSIQLARDSVILPERRDDDTPAKYLARLEAVVSRSVIASALSKSPDPFSQAVLRSYMRGFSFFGDPMDMSIRKLLMEAELPKETQQIDRCLQAFANRYHECNPGIYTGPDQAYFIAFSLLILHTDVFNKNNKYKMQKADYLKNTRGEGIFDDILECFYDNITYTPFIHVEDDLDINGERIVAHKARKKPSLFLGGSSDPVKRAAKDPIDPYTLIIDNKLDILRPNLKDVMHLDDDYSYLGTAKSLNLQELQKTFFKTGVLQIVSARSRPDAFMTEKTVTNPEEAQQGIVDIKITKVGLLWRKDAKKKKTRSPWQEWGAILTGAQLYFFRNTNWIKNLMHQLETHIKHGNDGIPVIFQPPLDHFKPDALMSTDGAVALLDPSYKKHKNAFVYVRHGGSEEVLLADDEDELNDWLAKLNYAAAFRTSGVRMRGVVGAGYDGQGRRAMRRLESDTPQSVVQTPSGEVTIARTRIDQKMAQDILEARRQIMVQRVAEANERLQVEEAKLEDQLTNARHLQILSPIQPKTRDQILLAAARMAAQLKWTRMEMWRLKCHRDILLMDLEEERQLLGLPAPVIPESGGTEKKSSAPLARKDSMASSSTAIVHQSPKSAKALASPPTGPALSDETEAAASPDSDAVQTPPPMTAGQPGHRHQNSGDMPALGGFDQVSLRKTSVSSGMSSTSRPMAASPVRKAGGTGSSHGAPVVATATSESGQPQVASKSSDEVDANERNLLQKTGLIDADSPSKSVDGKQSSSVAAGDGSAPADTRERRASQQHQQTDGKLDRSKLRRSLQRTLREGAGPFSHHRSSRRTKDTSSSASGAVGPIGGHHHGQDDEVPRDGDDGEATTDVLSRGTGSFVVHGKKASVINFGGDLQGIMSPMSEERFRQRMSQQQQLQQQPAPASHTTPSSPRDTSAEGEETSASTPVADFRAVLQGARRGEAERRESAASASTATALSFRELHRKYSSAQAAAAAAAVVASRSGGNLSLPDEDSDAAVSFSDGRGTPLPPIEHDSDEGEEELISPRGGLGKGHELRPLPVPYGSDSRAVSDDEDEDAESSAGSDDGNAGAGADRSDDVNDSLQPPHVATTPSPTTSKSSSHDVGRTAEVENHAAVAANGQNTAEQLDGKQHPSPPQQLPSPPPIQIVSA